MPCYDPQVRIDEAIQRRKLDITTRFCCEVLKEYDRLGVTIPEYISGWWREHKIADAERALEKGPNVASKMALRTNDE